MIPSNSYWSAVAYLVDRRGEREPIRDFLIMVSHVRFRVDAREPSLGT